MSKELKVNMFGTFSLSYDGQLINGKNKSSESGFISLMEALLHAGEKGVPRDELEQAIFQNADLKNIHHSTRNVIYNAKKRLLASGLPDVNYMEQKDGVFYWTDEIPVLEDAREFEQLIATAHKEKDISKKTNLLLDAIHLYKGEFLEAQASVLWIAKEARRYRELFCECVEEAAELLRQKEEWFILEDLGLYAAKVYPFSEWESLTMEALVAMSRYDDAIRFYEETSEYYMSVMGLRPTQRMQDLMKSLREDAPKEIAGLKVTRVGDYQRSVMTEADGAESVINLPKSNVLRFFLEEGCEAVVRPSGTEPKLKIYLTTAGKTADICRETAQKLEAFFAAWIGA